MVTALQVILCVNREALSSLLGVLEESALQDVLARAEVLRAWNQKLNPTSEPSPASAIAAAAAAAAALGPQASTAKPVRVKGAVVGASGGSARGEFGADLVIHAARLAGDPDAAVLAMCGALPGSDSFSDRCGAESDAETLASKPTQT